MKGTRHKPFEYIVWAEKYVIRAYYYCLAFPRIVTALTKIFIPLFMNRETFFNRLIRSAFLIVGGGMLKREDNRELRRGIRVVLNYMKSSGKQSGSDGRPVVWNGWCVSHEILSTFDVHIVVPEAMSVIGSFKGEESVARLLEAAEAQGIPSESCSASRVAVGSLLLDQQPRPDLIITSSHPCDSGVSAYPAIQYLTGAPMYVLDTPYWDDDRSYGYYEKNLWGMIRFLEKHLNKKMNWDLLKKVCEQENWTNYYLGEMSEMGRAIPCPVSVNLLIMGWILKLLAVGSSDVTHAVKGFYENARKRFDEGRGYGNREDIRVLFWDVPIAFANLFPWLEKEFGAVVVTDFIGRVNSPLIDISSEESMIRDLARVHLQVAMARNVRGPYEFITDEMERLIEEYSPDAMIFTGHNGCKHGSAVGSIKKNIVKRHGIPAVYMNTDIFDTRIASEDHIKRQITDFFRSSGLA